MFEYLLFLNELYFFDKKENCQTNYLFVYAFLYWNSAVLFEANCWDVLQRFDAWGVNVVEKTGEIHLLFVSIEAEQNFDFFFSLTEIIFLKKKEYASPGDDSFSSWYVVEKCQWMEVSSGGESFPISLKSVFLGLEECEVGADMIEDLIIFELLLFRITFSLHNDN